MSYGSYHEMIAAFWALYREEAWADALGLLVREGDSFPDEAAHVLYLRSCVAARSGQPEVAVRVLAGALERGLWYGEGLMRASPSWQSLQGRADFEGMVEICREREKAATAAASPALLVETPDDTASGPSAAPVLVAVHGNGDHAKAALAGWRPLVAHGWAVAAVQSSQVSGPERFGWFDQALAVREIEELVASLGARPAIDRGRTIIAGFQLGGEPALRVALRHRVQARGFVLIDPFGPATPPAEEWAALAAARPVSGLRGSILLADHALHLSHDLPRGIAAALTARGVSCDIGSEPGLGYDYPPDPWPAFSRALAHIEAPGA